MIIEDTFKIIDSIIKAQKKARQSNDFLAIVLNSEALLEYLPVLINYSVDKEGEYRKFEANLTNEERNGKMLTSSYCETNAKAQDSYREWQRAKNFIELIYQLVMMGKVLAKSVNSELNAQ